MRCRYVFYLWQFSWFIDQTHLDVRNVNWRSESTVVCFTAAVNLHFLAREYQPLENYKNIRGRK